MLNHCLKATKENNENYVNYENYENYANYENNFETLKLLNSQTFLFFLHKFLYCEIFCVTLQRCFMPNTYLLF